MYEQLDNGDYGEIEHEISKMWSLINDAIVQLSPKAQTITRDVIVLGLSFSEIEEKYQGLSRYKTEELLFSSLSYINNYLKDKDVHGF